MHETLGRVSIKTQSSKYINFAVEVEQRVSTDQRDYISGWFKSGKADWYLVGIRDDQNKGYLTTLHLINKEKLTKYLTANPVKDTLCWFAQKLNPNRKYDLPVVKLISLQTLKDNGIIEVSFSRAKQ